MRVIKFKWWDTINHKMQTMDAMGAELANVIGDSRYIPLQYTGMHDEKHLDIFEGDIVRVTVEQTFDDVIKIGMVQYSEDAAFVVLFEEYGVSMHLGQFEEIEVIGNIYQNPDKYHDRKAL